jgi:tyrosyl-tRNA synthetase
MFALFTDVPMSDVKQMIAEDIVKAKQTLSYEITKFVRGKEDADIALEATKSLFGNGTNLDNVPTQSYPASELSQKSLIDIVTETRLCSSKSESRRMIENGGISINNEKIVDIKYILSKNDVSEGYCLIRKGKKSYVKVDFDA